MIAIAVDRGLRQVVPASLRVHLGIASLPRVSVDLLTDEDGSGRSDNAQAKLLARYLLPSTAVFSHVEQIGKVEYEVDKNATSFSARFHYSNSSLSSSKPSSRYEYGKQLLSKDVFLKFQTGADFPLWLQAIRWAAEGEVLREVDFYDKIAPNVLIRVPKLYYLSKTPVSNTICLAMEYFPITSVSNDKDNESPVSTTKVKQKDDKDHNNKLEYYVFPDWKIDSSIFVEMILSNVAKLHVQYLHDPSSLQNRRPEARWVPAQRGLDFCKWVKTIGPKDLTPFHEVFDAIDRYFSNKVVTVVHGDCRPGNMIFSGFRSSSSRTRILQDVIFCDFEAVNVAPPMWDVAYALALGLPEELHTTEEIQRLIELYRRRALDTLEAEGRTDVVLDSVEELYEQVQILHVHFFFYSYAVYSQGFWDDHGNSEDDMRVWGERSHHTWSRIDCQKVSQVLEIDLVLMKNLRDKAMKSKKY